MKSTIRRTVALDEEQNLALEEWKWEFRKSCSKIVRILINYYIRNPNELKTLIKEDK
jgi:hypothetical protein